MIAEEKYKPAGFEAPLALKDIRLALSAADERSVPMPFASVLRDGLMELISMGGSEDDWAALAKVAARRAGLSSWTCRRWQRQCADGWSAYAGAQLHRPC